MKCFKAQLPFSTFVPPVSKPALIQKKPEPLSARCLQAEGKLHPEKVANPSPDKHGDSTQDSVTPEINLKSAANSTCVCLDHERNLCLKKTHSCTERTCKLYAERAESQVNNTIIPLTSYLHYIAQHFILSILHF